jgi:hypothetical protein
MYWWVVLALLALFSFLCLLLFLKIKKINKKINNFIKYS